jgi:hypothetical protein
MLCPALFVCIALVWSPLEAEARIGERKDTIERRLFSSGGIIYRDDATRQNRQRRMPYLKYLDFFGGSSEVRVYFKTADGRKPASSELEEKNMGDGWDLHVVYVNGKSVLEVYKRSQKMSEHELNYLLTQAAQGSFWKRVEKDEMAEAVSAFGFEMVRDDGSVRSKKLGGDSILFVASGVDERLAKLNDSDLQEKAPVSVDGF